MMQVRKKGPRHVLWLPCLALLLVSAAPPLAPGEEADLYREGVAARLSGDHGRAVDLLRRAAAAEPDNADAHLQLGLALMAAGRLDEAETSLRRTLALAPGYEDARIGLARIAQRRGDNAGALAELGPVGAANSEAAALRSQLQGSETPGYRWRVELDGSYSALEGGAPDWKEGSVQVRRILDNGTTIGAGIEAARRFGKSDIYGEARIEQRLAGGGGIYVSAGGTPNADFRPRWQIGAGGAAKVRGGPQATVLTIDARQARYRSGDIQTVSPGIEQYLTAGRIWLTGRWINIFDENGTHRGGWLARGDILAGPRARLFAGLADAPDVSEGVVTDTFSVFGGVSLDVTDRSSVRLSLARENREQGADRTQIGIGLGLRF